MATPWLSVAMTTYNSHDYLAVALDSIVAQEDGGVEVIVDDGSTDDTLEIIARYRSRLNLKLIAREHSGNWFKSMNIGLRTGRGGFACFLHHDDVWFADRIATAEAALARHPETILLLNPSWFIDRTGACLNVWNCPSRDGGDPTAELVVDRLLIQNFIAVPAPIFLRDAAQGLGGLDEINWYSADWDFWLKLAALGPTTHISRPTTGYRVHSVAATWSGTDRAATYRWQMDAVLEKHITTWEARLPIRPSVRRVARFSVEDNLCLAAYCARASPEVGRLGGSLSDAGAGRLASVSSRFSDHRTSFCPNPGRDAWLEPSGKARPPEGVQG